MDEATLADVKGQLNDCRFIFTSDPALTAILPVLDKKSKPFFDRLSIGDNAAILLELYGELIDIASTARASSADSFGAKEQANAVEKLEDALRRFSTAAQ
jgi:hypothetical protein